MGEESLAKIQRIVTAVTEPLGEQDFRLSSSILA